MEPGNPDVIDQVPAGGNVMKPASGTYGDVATTERMKGQLELPGSDTGQPSTQPAPAAPPGAPNGQQVPQPQGGVPDVLMGPSTRPGTPVGSPLDQGATPTAVNGAQARLRALDQLANNPNVSKATRDWAEHVMKLLVQGD